MNREQWLTELSGLCTPLFKGFLLKPFRLTCGWPSKYALGGRQRRIGECHAIESSKGGFHEIFISPVLDDPKEVAGVVVHEMTHVAAGIASGHTGAFVKICKYIGLTRNKPTQAAPGALLADKLNRLMDGLGTYPHSAIVPTLKEKKPSSTLRLICPACSCKVSMSTKWFEEAGCPTCACGQLFGLVEEEEEQ